MTERATIHQYTQFAVETTPGTRPAGGANRRHPALGIDIEPQLEAEYFRPKGHKFPTIVSPNREWVTASLNAAPDYNLLTWLFNMILDAATPAQQGATAAYQHEFTPDAKGSDDCKTLWIEEGGSVRAHGFGYALLNELGLEITRGGISLSGALIGQRLQDNISLGTNEVQTLSITGAPTGGTFTISLGGQTTAAIAYNATAAEVQAALELISTIGAGNVVCTGGPLPATAVVIEFRGALARTDVATVTTTASLTGGTTPATAVAATTAGAVITESIAKPILPGHVSVYLDTTGAGLGTTKLTRLLRVNPQFGGERHGPVWALNRSETSYVAHVEGEPEWTCELMLEADSTGMGLITPLRAGDKRFLRIEAIGPLIAGAFFYTLILDLCLQFGEAYSFSDEEGVYAVTYPARVSYDATWGKAAYAKLINEITAI